MDECKPLVVGRLRPLITEMDEQRRDLVAKVGRCRLTLSNPR